MTKIPENDQEVDRTLMDEGFPRFAYDVDLEYRDALERDVSVVRSSKIPFEKETSKGGLKISQAPLTR